MYYSDKSSIDPVRALHMFWDLCLNFVMPTYIRIAREETGSTIDKNASVVVRQIQLESP